MKKTLVYRGDAPVLSGKELARPDVKWRIGGKEVSAQEGRAAMQAKLRGKVRVNIHLDKDIVAYFKGEAGTRGYQTLINSALRGVMQGADLKDDLLEAMNDTLKNWLTQNVAASAPTVRAFAQLKPTVANNYPLGFDAQRGGSRNIPITFGSFDLARA